jgi:HSP20 family protein
MYRALFPGDLLADFDRFQRHLQHFSRPAANIRGPGRGEFPALHIGSTPESFELYVFSPGLDPASIDLTVERGVLSISGERKNALPNEDNKHAIHFNERFGGRFHRAVSLSDDADPNQVAAKYVDGVLHISIKRRTAAQRRRIDIQ